MLFTNSLVALFGALSISLPLVSAAPQSGLVINPNAPIPGVPWSLWVPADPQTSKGDAAYTPILAQRQIRQATRENVIARAAAKFEAKRAGGQSAVLGGDETDICKRPDTGDVPYAVFTDGYFYANKRLSTTDGLSIEECYSACENTSACVAATYFGAQSRCYQLAALVKDGGQYLGIDILVGEIKGYTCETAKAAFPNLADSTCCDTKRAATPMP